MTAVSGAAYTLGRWAELFTVTATVAATLLGLLFVVLTLDRDQLTSDPVRSAWARECFGGLVALLVIGLSGLVPESNPKQFGIALIALGAILAAIGVSLQIRTLHRLPLERRPTWLLRVGVLNAAALTTIVAGATLLAQSGGGLYWILATVAIYLGWSLANAWRLVIPAREPDGQSGVVQQ